MLKAERSLPGTGKIVMVYRYGVICSRYALLSFWTTSHQLFPEWHCFAQSIDILRQAEKIPRTTVKTRLKILQEHRQKIFNN